MDSLYSLQFAVVIVARADTGALIICWASGWSTIMELGRIPWPPDGSSINIGRLKVGTLSNLHALVVGFINRNHVMKDHAFLNGVL